MAFATVGRNVEGLWFSQKTFSRILCGFTCIGIWITAMTIIARQAPSPMYVVFEIPGRRTQSRIVQLDVAFDTGTLLLRGSESEKRQDDQRRKQSLSQAKAPEYKRKPKKDPCGFAPLREKFRQENEGSHFVTYPMIVITTM
jgi:hypothetical protein